MSVTAYKGFKENLTNKYGTQFEVGKLYQKDKESLNFGENNGHGFHMATSLADTFRYFNPSLNNIYCEVEGSRRIVMVEDANYQASPMLVSEEMVIKKVLTRKDILEKVLSSNESELIKYINLYPFNKEKLVILKHHLITFSNDDKLLDMVSVWQTGNRNNFRRNKLYLRPLIK